MSKLILPNGNGTGPRSLKRGSDFITIDEAQAMMVSVYGPLASLVKQMAIRLNMDDVEEQSHSQISGDLE